MEPHSDKRGWLILVAGPSGAGKDSVMAGALERLTGQFPVVLAQRVITRAPEPDGERNFEVSAAAFAQMKAEGEFLLDWEAHGLSYAIPRSIVSRLEAGTTVLANVSRTRIVAGLTSYARTAAVLIHASDAVRAERLSSRGREAQPDQKARLSRSVDDFPVDMKIDNDGAIEDSIQTLSDFIARRVSDAVLS